MYLKEGVERKSFEFLKRLYDTFGLDFLRPLHGLLAIYLLGSLGYIIGI